MATNFVKCSYEEVIDLHTDPKSISVVGIHTPTGDTPRRMFRGYFDQYKKYKYLGASIKFVPAARLPSDMLQVSYEAGDYIDPRDQMNPIMFHGCHGDDMGTILNKLYGDNSSLGDSLSYLQHNTDASGFVSGNPEFLEALYYKALTDNTWKKANNQRGFVKNNLRPLLYTLAVNRQIMPGSLGTKGLAVGFNGTPVVAQDSGDPVSFPDDALLDLSDDKDVNLNVNYNNLQFMTPRLTGLGWMDTKNVMTRSVAVEGIDDDTPLDLSEELGLLEQGVTNQTNYAELPKIYMGVVLLSRMYKVAQFYRVIIKHRFAFKNFRGISFMPEWQGSPYWNANVDGGFEDAESNNDFLVAESSQNRQDQNRQNLNQLDQKSYVKQNPVPEMPQMNTEESTPESQSTE